MNYSYTVPDKGDGIFDMNWSDYIISVEGFFDNYKFRQIPVDPTLLNYLSFQTLKSR